MFQRSAYACLLVFTFLAGVAAGYLARNKVSLRAKSLVGGGLFAALEQDAGTIVKETRRRFLAYDDMIQRRSLENGMIVIKDIRGKVEHRCDSLLFSALRYSALEQAGFEDRARRAWSSLKRSHIEGRWRRHPLCLDPPNSRDMILGLLLSLLEHPSQGERVLADLLGTISDNFGFFDQGPIYISYATPQVGELIRLVSISYGFDESDLPANVRMGFSTLDLNSLSVDSGYQAHLLALSLWIEMEVHRQAVPIRSNSLDLQARSLLREALGIIAEVEGEKNLHLRWQMIAERLLEVDPDNLFFEYLLLKTKGFGSQDAVGMLARLNAMSEFPKGALPMNCDRRADYLWQRDSREWRSGDETCELVYPGVDFLWMAALLLRELDSEEIESREKEIRADQP